MCRRFRVEEDVAETGRSWEWCSKAKGGQGTVMTRGHAVAARCKKCWIAT